ncbi:D-alanine--D-alanine ligase [Acidobacteria bacterium Mor1]|nr:D-alanine--D-alanine ligase [Acidobacteria bacterium Mor1]
MTKIRVGVMFGGRSGEHEVSLASAASVLEGLRGLEGYEVLPIGISPEGRWICRPDALDLLNASAAFRLPGTDDGSAAAAAAAQSDAAQSADPAQAGGLTSAAGALEPRVPEQLDVVFPVVHGPTGEDGVLQGMLETFGIPYVGCGVAASAVCMDKHLTKTVLRGAGLPVVDWMVVRAAEWEAGPEPVLQRLEALGNQVFVKPANMGSSVGISRATDAESLRAGIDEALRYDRLVLVEKGVDAREIEISVLGNDIPEASVPGEIIPERDFYDYRAKYLEDSSRLVIPAELDPGQTAELQSLAVEAFKAVGGSGMARVDFLLDRQSGRIDLNEINTIPGFTSISMYAKLWEASGVSYGELLDRLVRLALERHRNRAGLSVRYTPD